jgi:hypothetical protein
MTDDTPRGFSDQQARVLDGVLDDIIPRSADGRLPGAGELGLADSIAAGLHKMPELRAMIEQGVSALDDLARKRWSQGFASLAPPERSAALNELASSEHAFPPVLLLHTYAAYYRHPRIVAALGLEPRPPHPKGYEMGDDDLTLLDVVRRRGPLYRRL